MKQFAEKAKALSLSALVLALVFTLGLTLSGCSHDDDDNPAEVSYANLVIKHSIVYGRSLDLNVERIILSGYDEAGESTIAPTEFTRMTNFTKTVPLTTKSVRLAYLDEENNIIGLYAQSVALQAGADYVIDDPAWQDLSSQKFLTSLTLSPEDSAINEDDYVHLTALGTFSNGGTFVQDVTKEAEWSLADESHVLYNADKGVYCAFTTGQTEAVASYGGVSATATVTVLGTEGVLSVRAVNVSEDEITEGSYLIPMCLDDAANVLPKYASEYAFAPAAFNVVYNGNDTNYWDNLKVTCTKGNVVRPEIVTLTAPQNEKILVLHPLGVGQTVVEVAYNNGTVEHKAYISVETFEAKLDRLLNRNDGIPEAVEISHGGTFVPVITGVFKDVTGQRTSYAEVSGICGHEFTVERGASEEPSFVLDGTYYVAGGEQTIIKTVYRDDYSISAAGDVCKHTLTAPDGIKIYSEANDENDIAVTSLDTLINIGDPLELGIEIEGMEPIEGFRFDGVTLTEGETFNCVVNMLYSDESVVDVTSNAVIADRFEDYGNISIDGAAITAVREGWTAIDVTVGDWTRTYIIVIEPASEE